MTPSERRLAALRRNVRPMRRLLAYTALVDEEVRNRAEHVNRVEQNLVHHLHQVRGEVLGRMDVVIQELWRRAEGADARTATAVQQLMDRVAEVEAQVGAALHLLVPPATEGAAPAAGVRALGIDEQRLADEVAAPDEGDGALAAYFRHLRTPAGPVIDLGCGRGLRFLALAREAGVSAYGIDPGGSLVQEGGTVTLDVRAEGILEHLRSLPEGGTGGVFCARLVENLTAVELGELLQRVARALHPGGAAIVETANPASFATHAARLWGDPARSRPIPAEALSLLARAAGLDVATVIYSSPARSEELRPVEAQPGGEAAAVAEALNIVVARLNEVLYGPRTYALVAVRPA